ncbi:hypothetical protein F6Y05_34955 [Bacillus megaterium]|nr:hypothetical protein [Priestia megaterium]
MKKGIIALGLAASLALPLTAQAAYYIYGPKRRHDVENCFKVSRRNFRGY